MAKIMEKIKKIFSTQIVFKPKPHLSAEKGEFGKSEESKAQPKEPQPEQKPEEQKQ